MQLHLLEKKTAVVPFFNEIIFEFAYTPCLGISACPQCRRPGFESWVGKIPWRRKWQPTPVPLSGKSHERRSLVGYSPWGHKELDMTERLHFTFVFGKYDLFFLFFLHLPFLWLCHTICGVITAQSGIGPASPPMGAWRES